MTKNSKFETGFGKFLNPPIPEFSNFAFTTNYMQHPIFDRQPTTDNMQEA